MATATSETAKPQFDAASAATTPVVLASSNNQNERSSPPAYAQGGGNGTPTAEMRRSLSNVDRIGNTSSSRKDIVTVLVGGDEVDSALLAAMREPRERVALLRLENALLDFMKSDSGWLEVTGPYNSIILSPNTSTTPPVTDGRGQTSFQRCILHRLADRFGIVREQGSLLMGSIRLIKLPGSKIPTKLLQNMDPSDYNTVDPRHSQPDPQLISMTRSFANSTIGEAKTGGGLTLLGSKGKAGKKPGKMKIMKRTDQNKNSASGGISNGAQRKFTRKTSSELSEKEKAYAEARARIFNEESSSSSLGPAISAGIDANNSSHGSAKISNTTGPSLSTTIAETNTYSSNDSTSGNPKDFSRRISSSNSLQHQDSSGNMLSQQQQDEQMETKAVYRNRAEEAADPDFRRRSGVVKAPNVYANTHSALAGTPSPYGGVVAPCPAGAWVAQPFHVVQQQGYYQQQQQQQQQQYYQYPLPQQQQQSHQNAYGQVAGVVSSKSNSTSTRAQQRAVLQAAAPSFYPPPAKTGQATTNGNSLSQTKNQ